MQTNKSSTRRSLLVSATALILSIAMLVGTTFAWFTDTASSGVNKIQAGNLDVEVEYSKDGSIWKPMQDSDEVFDKNALWEPGRTEVVYLKVINKGTLAFIYDLKVTPVRESGGIGPEGDFLLSDVLKVGITTPKDSFTGAYPTRTDARDAIIEDGTIKEDTLKASSQLNPNSTNDACQYIALVVYMPESVGNKYNYLTGTTPPSIQLGVNLTAKQASYEKDSFDERYDEQAPSLPNEFEYTFVPQMNGSGTVTMDSESGGATVEGSVSVDGDYVSVASKQQTGTSDPLMKVDFPLSALQGDSSSHVVEVQAAMVPDGGNIGVSVGSERDIIVYDIKTLINGEVKTLSNGAFYKNQLFIGTGKQNVEVYHKHGDTTELISNAVYNETTGFVTFTSTNYSEFGFVFDKAVAVVDNTPYYTLKDAVAAVSDGGVVKVLRDAQGSGIGTYLTPAEGQIKSKSFTIDFNGFTYTVTEPPVGSKGYESQAFHLERKSAEDSGDVILKNGKLNATGTGVKMLVQNYTNLTLQDMVLEGNGNIGYVLSNNCGKSTITGNTSIVLNGANVAFDVYAGFQSYPQVGMTVNTTGTIEGTIEFTTADASNIKQTNDVAYLSIQNGNFTGKLVVGNTQGSITVSGGTFSFDPSAYCKSGLGAIQDGNVYKIVDSWINHAEGALTETNGVYEISTAEQLATFAKMVNVDKISFSGKTVKLTADINLNGHIWTPVGQTGATQFQGTFDGQEHTIKNMTVYNTDEGGNCASGLFGWLNTATVKNLTVDGANVTGHHNVGVIAGYMESLPNCTIENCHVKNATINCTSVNDEANGDKCGGIVGYANNGGTVVKNCTVTNTTISAGRDAGQVVGAVLEANVSGCSATNVTVTANGTSTGANIRNEVIGRVV